MLAWGSNVFNQIHPEADSGSAPYTVQDAASILAICTYQTVVLTQSGDIQVLGEAPGLIGQAIQSVLDDQNSRRSSETDELVFVGYDIFEAVLDIKRNRCCFVQYGEEEEEGSVDLVEGSSWKTAAVDGRGRCMAVDLDGQVYLFDSVAILRAATGKGEDAVRLRDARRFTAHQYSPAGSSSTATTELPKFDKVTAGNAHFVLLTQDSKEVCPVWIFGDARFGSVPLHPFDHITLVGLLPPTDSSPEQPTPSTAPADVPFLMPVPHFSPNQGFPSRIATAAVGARHTLILTSDGDIYGWGWNEDSPLLPFGTTTEPQWENNLVYEPTLIPLPSHPSTADNTLALTKIAASNGRSFGITMEGRLVVAGSNEGECLALDLELGGLEKTPRFEREFSQIKKAYDCVNGWQLHPEMGAMDGGRVVDVRGTSLVTFITVQVKE